MVKKIDKRKRFRKSGGLLILRAVCIKISVRNWSLLIDIFFLIAVGNIKPFFFLDSKNKNVLSLIETKYEINF